MLHDETIFRKESTGHWPPQLDGTFFPIEEMAWFLLLQSHPADPGFVFVNGIEPNFNILPEKLRCLTT